MTLTNFGDNFEIEEDSNGDYVVTYLPTDTVIERIDSGNAEKIFEVGTRISDLVDNTSGNTVYDSSTETIGDGNQDLSVESVDADEELNKQHVLGIDSGGLFVRQLSEFSDAGAAVIDALGSLATGGGQIKLPRAGLTASQQINIPNGNGTLVQLIGRGMGHAGGEGSRFSAGSIPNGNDVINVTGGGGRGTVLRNFGIFGMPGGAGDAAIRFHNVTQNGKIEDVEVRSVPADTVAFDLDSNFSTEYYAIHAFGGNGVGKGIQGTNENAASFFSPICRRLDTGMELFGASGVTITGANMESNATFGLRMNSGVTGAAVVGGYFEDNTYGIEARGTGISIQGATIRANNSIGIRVNGGSGHIAGNDYEANTNYDIQLVNGAHDVTINEPPSISVASDGSAYDIHWPENPEFNGERGVNPSSSTYRAAWYTAFSEKPNLDVMTENGTPVSWTLSNWTTDTNGRYTGVDIEMSATPTALHWSAY